LLKVFKSKEVYSVKSNYVLIDSTTSEDGLFVISMNFSEVCDPTLGKGNKFLADMCGFFKEVEEHTPNHLNQERDVLHIVYNKKYEEVSAFVEFVHYEHASIKDLTKLFRIFSKLSKDMKAYAYLRYFNDYGEHMILTLTIYRVDNPESPIWSFIEEMMKVAGL